MVKSFLSTAGKLAFAAVLIYWLVHSGQLDFSQLKLFQKDAALVAATLFYYSVGVVCLGTWRWQTLLKGAGYTLTFGRAIALQMTGLFFSTVMPGAVGGDIIKIAYVIRDNPHKSKTLAMTTALLDRIVGLAALFMICWIMIVFNYQTIADTPGFWPILGLMSAFTAGFILFFAAALFHYRGRDPILKLFTFKKIPGLPFIEKLYNAVRIYRYERGTIVLSILISVVIQTMSLVLFYIITGKILGEMPVFGKIAVIFPIGVTTTAIPITPGGLGVGHVAFDQLFQMVGMQHGANVFNLFVLSQLFLNLSGVVPYLSLKKLRPGETVVAEPVNTERSPS